MNDSRLALLSSEVPSAEVISYFEGEIKTDVPPFNGTLLETDIEQKDGVWKITEDALGRLKAEYIQAVTLYAEKLTAELAKIPSKIIISERQRDSLPAPDSSAYKSATSQKRALGIKKSKVKDWTGGEGAIQMTADHQRKAIQQEIDACDTIIQEYEARRAARSGPNKEIEDLKRRQRGLETEISKLSDKDNLTQSFQRTCGQLKFVLAPTRVENTEKLEVEEVKDTVANATVSALRATRTPIQWPAWLNMRNAAVAIVGAGAIIGGGFAVKQYQKKQEQKLEWKTTLLSDYFFPAEIAMMEESDVERYSSLSAQIKDLNRNHNLGLSEEKIVKLVRLGDMMKVCMIEPRLSHVETHLHEQVQKRWQEFFARHHVQITMLYSQGKFVEMLDFMRMNDEIFAHIPKESTTVMSHPTDIIGLRINNGENGFYFILGHELIPEKFVGLSEMVKGEILTGKITIQDLGVGEKNGARMSEKMADFLGLDKAKFAVTAHLVSGTDFIQITIHNTDGKGPIGSEFCMIDVGSPLREFTKKNDPEGIEIMKQGYRGPGETTHIDVEVEQVVEAFLKKNVTALQPTLQKIESDFRNPHHDYPATFLQDLEKNLQTEITAGPLGHFFGPENITVLCNSISQNGIGVHIYICRADSVIFTAINMSSTGASRYSLHPGLQEKIGQELEQYFIKNPHDPAPDIHITSEGKKVSILPRGMTITTPLMTAPGVTLGAILKYTTIFQGDTNGQQEGYIHIPDFGEKIGGALLLPRGLEKKTSFHPIEIESVKEALGKLPGMEGRDIHIGHALIKGKKRAVATVGFSGMGKIDVVLPEAEDVSVSTNMSPEDNHTLTTCVHEAQTNFGKHGAITQFGAELTQRISEQFRAKLSSLNIKPEIINNEYQFRIKVELIDGTKNDTLITTNGLVTMIQSYLTLYVVEEKILSDVDYSVKLNGVERYTGTITNISYLAPLQQKLYKEGSFYEIDFGNSGITVTTTGEPIFRVAFKIYNVPTPFFFDLSAKNQWNNDARKPVPFTR